VILGEKEREREREKEKEREGEGEKEKVRGHICDDVKYALLQRRTDSFLCIKRPVLVVSQASVEAIRFSPSPHLPPAFSLNKHFYGRVYWNSGNFVARAVLGF